MTRCAIGNVDTRSPRRYSRCTPNGEPLARLRPSSPTSAPNRDRPGRVVEIVGRRVMVADEEGTRTCFLSGHRAVVGDRVRWTTAQGEGGKITEVEPRDHVLRRIDIRGEEQVLAANIEGLMVVIASIDPPFAPPLLDRYLVAAEHDGLKAAILLNKVDLGVPDDVNEELAARDWPLFRVSVRTGEGLDAVRAFLADAKAPWTLVGPSGVGKTSVMQALLPEETVGPIGEISDYWGTGRHTTTRTRLFSLPTGGELADSPGIRGFIPAVLDPIAIRDHYPGVAGLGCRYRDCLHLPGEDGCVAERDVRPAQLSAYRALLGEAQQIARRRGP